MKSLWLFFALWLIVITFSTRAQQPPTIREVAAENDEGKSLNTSVTQTYKKFKNALQEKRLNVFDDSTDYALLHYKTLKASTVPDQLRQITQRNLGAALMERELEILKDVKEKGKGSISRDEKVLLLAIANLEEALQLFEPTHHLHPLIEARIAVLKSQLSPKVSPVLAQSPNLSKELLLKSLALEPNMVSTYALLASVYHENQQFDSAIYYQEKVVEQLSNQGYAYFHLAINYEATPYTDMQNRPAPHPKAIANFEKAISLEPTLQEAYTRLGNLYMGLKPIKHGEPQMIFDKVHRNYPKAILCFEKITEPYEVVKLIDHWKTLYFLHKANGEKAKAKVYLKKILQKVRMDESALNYSLAARKMIEVFEWSDDKADLDVAFNLQMKALKMATNELKAHKDLDQARFKAKYFPPTEKK